MIFSRRLSGIDAHIWVWTRRLVVQSLDELHSDGKEIAARLLSNITSTCSLSHECDLTVSDDADAQTSSLLFV